MPRASPGWSARARSPGGRESRVGAAGPEHVPCAGSRGSGVLRPRIEHATRVPQRNSLLRHPRPVDAPIAAAPAELPGAFDDLRRARPQARSAKGPDADTASGLFAIPGRRRCAAWRTWPGNLPESSGLRAGVAGHRLRRDPLPPYRQATPSGDVGCRCLARSPPRVIHRWADVRTTPDRDDVAFSHRG